MKDLKDLVRPNIWCLEPYSCARTEFKGREARVFLDANESPYDRPYNRYPDPLQEDLKQDISMIKGVAPEQIFLGNGSDEAIDLVYRIFCNPQRDNVVAMEPTYGMYQVCADINNVEYRKVLLDEKFGLHADKILGVVNDKTKVIFLCSPNNPSGNCLDEHEIEKVIRNFDGIVVVDEAYSDFSLKKTFRERLDDFPNLIVLNTFSKAWASAGIRLGMAFAQQAIIELFNKVKYPYNINMLTQERAQEMIKKRYDVENWVKLILLERPKLMEAVAMLKICEKIYPTDANFFLVKMTGATKIYEYLVDCGVIVRNRSRISLCQDCLRITVGAPEENNALVSALRKYRS
jgi:histidinol-phosphate aminotransferase